MTFVVDDVDELYQKVLSENFKVINEPTNKFYDQRRLLLQDPDGTVVDISSLIPK